MTLIFFALSVLLPAALATMIVFRRWHNGWPLLGLIAFTLGGMIYSGFNAPWQWYSYWLLALVSIVVAASVVIGISRLRRLDWAQPALPTLLATLFLFAGAAYFGVFAFNAIAATQRPVDIVELEFPMKDGVFAITQSGSAPPLQHGHALTSAQVYAVDVVKINGLGMNNGSWLGDDRAGDETLGEAVYSPCDGDVVWMRDGLPNEPDVQSETPAGNAVAIACKGIVIAFGHLATGTVDVAIGDSVEVGQMLGRVGMSGRTFGPHLHFHAERGTWQGDYSDNPGVAMSFDGAILWTGRLIDRRN